MILQLNAQKSAEFEEKSDDKFCNRDFRPFLFRFLFQDVILFFLRIATI